MSISSGTHSSPAFGWLRALAIAGVIGGIVLLFLAVGMEWRGFWGGMLQGAGVGAALVSCYLLGYVHGIARRGVTRTWLPSRGPAA
jgi:uncharacterized iron-regulated membrane protein